jgi:hypothetical protein
MSWLQDLKFLDGYAAGFRRVVNMESGKINGLKCQLSHIHIKTHSYNISRVLE